MCSQEVVAGSHYRYIYLSLHLVDIDTSSRDSMCDEGSSRSTEALTTSASLIGLPKCDHSAVTTFCEEVISEVRLKILGRLVFSHSYFSYSRMEAFRNATMSCAPHGILALLKKDEYGDQSTDEFAKDFAKKIACDRAWTRLTEARQWAERVLKEGTRIAAAPPHPPSPAAPPPTAGMSVARPPEPEGTKAPRLFGWDPLDPLPPPHPNFGALRVVVVD